MPQLNEQYNNIIYIKRFVKHLFLLFIFILPFQTRLIYEQRFLNRGYWEYGTKSLYAVEIILFAAIFLYIVGALNWLIKNPNKKKHCKENFKKNIKSPIILLPLLLLLWAGISIFFSFDKTLAWYKWTVLMQGVIVFLFLAKKIVDKNRIVIALALGAAVQSCFALYQFSAQKINANKWLGIAKHLPHISGTSVIETASSRWLRAYGTLPHPNILAAYLGIALVAILILKRDKIHFNFHSLVPPFSKVKSCRMTGRGKGGFKAIILLISTGILLAFSRAVWIGIIAAAILSFIFFREKIKQYKFSKINIFILLFFIFFIFLLREPIITRIKGNNRLEQRSNQEHILSYKESTLIIKNNWLTGVGIGNYTLALFKQNPNLPSYSYQPSHNLFLIIWAELGIIGFILFILFLFFLAKQLIVKKSSTIILLIFILIISLFDHYFWTLYFGVLLFWLSAGLALDFD